MNAKRAKRLRREARALTVGRRAVSYVRGRGEMIMAHPNTTRGVYLKLKAAA